MPTVVGLGRGRTSTCSMISFAIRPVDTSLTQHVSTVTELDLQRRIRLFPAEDTKRKKENEKLTVKTLPAKEVASFICFGGKKTVK